jgi:lipopolysaccharide export LptBFGC system permease protein LptF
VEPDGEASPRARPGRTGDYRSARIGAAAAFVFVLVVLLVSDVFVDDYELSPIVLGILVGAVGGLLGVELLSALKGLLK